MSYGACQENAVAVHFGLASLMGSRDPARTLALRRSRLAVSSRPLQAILNALSLGSRTRQGPSWGVWSGQLGEKHALRCPSSSSAIPQWKHTTDVIGDQQQTAVVAPGVPRSVWSSKAPVMHLECCGLNRQATRRGLSHEQLQGHAGPTFNEAI